MFTDNQLRVLTEYCGECPHEWQYVKHRASEGYFVCVKCKGRHHGMKDRLPIPPTFTTPADKDLLAQYISRKGEWMRFREYINQIWKQQLSPEFFQYFDEWLLTLPAEEFCGLWCRWKGVE